MPVDEKKSKERLLCSFHFSPDAFESFSRQLLKERTGGKGYKRRLKPNALPSIFPHKESKRSQISSEIHAEKFSCLCHFSAQILFDILECVDTLQEKSKVKKKYIASLIAL